MASTIILKNGTGSAVPSSLTHGELAINVDNGALFYGTSGSSNAVSSSFLFSHISSSTITASSHISTSGNVYGTRGVFVSRVQTPAIRNAEGALAITSDDGPIVAEGNITASTIVEFGVFN